MAFEVSSVPLSLTMVFAAPTGGLCRPALGRRVGRRSRYQRSAPDTPDAVIDHRQDPKAPAIGQLVVNEVQAPTLVSCHRHLDRPPRSQRPLASAAPANRQTLFAVEPLHPLLIDDLAFSPQQHVQAPITEPPPLLRQGFQPLPQCAILGTHSSVAHAGAVGPDHPASPPLAHLKGLTQLHRCLSSCGGRHHFFPRRSFSAALSSTASASIRFSRPFSSSSAFSRLASDTSSPPNLAFHL